MSNLFYIGHGNKIQMFCSNKETICPTKIFFLLGLVKQENDIRFFTMDQSDAFLSDYLIDLKLHRTK